MMSLFRAIQDEIANCAVVRPEANDQDKLVTRTMELLVSRSAEDEWLFHLTKVEVPACVKTDRCYSRIEKAIYEQSEEEIPNFRFLLRTAFECRFCYEGIVSLHAACV